MASKKRSETNVTNQADNKGVVIGGDAVGNIIQTGDNNTVNQNFFQRIYISLFQPDTESLDQRNRRILLNHVDNFWVKGVLEKSLHGAAMLELGIKEDPSAVTYPWAIKKESTDETLPAGMPMLEIFEQIGNGRSLLILGAPGSGKTTMLLELARGLIERARQNADEPIPMVFNLASWTEKLSLADWLAQELNNIYYVPRKTAPDWVKGNKLLLLLDGLDEVRQESRAKCVGAINQFRKEHGLTSLAVCSRSQDYADLGAKLAFDGAIEVQPLTQKQVNEFFNRFGKEMAGLKSVLKKDSALREMAETPLFLSIMVMAYRNKQAVDITIEAQNKYEQRRHLFDNYIEKMFENPRTKNPFFNKEDVAHWLSWLASKMIKHNQTPYLLENMQPDWLYKKSSQYNTITKCLLGLMFTLLYGSFAYWLFLIIPPIIPGLLNTPEENWLPVILLGMGMGVVGAQVYRNRPIQTVDSIIWSWQEAKAGLFSGCIGCLLFFLIIFLYGLTSWVFGNIIKVVWNSIGIGLLIGLIMLVSIIVEHGLGYKEINKASYPGEKILMSIKNSLIACLPIFITGFVGGLVFQIIYGYGIGVAFSIWYVILVGTTFSFKYGALAVVQHYSLRFILQRNNYIPRKLIPFLDYCTDLIFLRRVGGGYIFVHRLLMEHFAAMYKEE